MSGIEITVPRGLDMNLILERIVDWGLTLDKLTIHRDTNFINLSVSSQHDLDIGMFEEFIMDLEYEHDKEFDINKHYFYAPQYKYGDKTHGGYLIWITNYRRYSIVKSKIVQISWNSSSDNYSANIRNDEIGRAHV